VLFASIEESDDEVVVRLSGLVGSTGYGTSGGDLPQVVPYPFPDDSGLSQKDYDPHEGGP
jgi:hypothetical protein